MQKAVYQIVPSSKVSDFYDLFENDILLCSFSRRSFREKLELLGRGNNWIGSILRIFNQKFPAPPSSPTLRPVEDYNVHFLLELARAKGFRVWKNTRISDVDLVLRLEQEGYCIEGIVEGEFYSSVLSAVGGVL